MKIKTQQVPGNRVSLDIEVPQGTVKKKFDEVYEKIGKDAKIPGFRPGKAPRHVLEQHHSKLAHEEVLKDLVSETYQESVKSQNLDVIDVPKISEVKLDASSLSYKAEVEVKPEIKLKQYKGLKLKSDEVKVDPVEIEDFIKQLKKARGGEITDEELARRLGYKTKEELRDCLDKQKFLQKENEQRSRLEKELINQLLKMVSFKAPDTLIERRASELEYQAEEQMKSLGLAADKIKQRIQEFKPKLKTEAEEQVKVFLILETIAKLENIKLDDQMINNVVEFLFAQAQWQ